MGFGKDAWSLRNFEKYKLKNSISWDLVIIVILVTLRSSAPQES